MFNCKNLPYKVHICMNLKATFMDTFHPDFFSNQILATRYKNNTS